MGLRTTPNMAESTPEARPDGSVSAFAESAPKDVCGGGRNGEIRMAVRPMGTSASCCFSGLIRCWLAKWAVTLRNPVLVADRGGAHWRSSERAPSKLSPGCPSSHAGSTP
eukprot:scaffold1762_cov383-Prasinococcus_capsulatus_cf.AAC.20